MAFPRVYSVRGLPGKTVTRKQYLNIIILHIQCHCAPSVNLKNVNKQLCDYSHVHQWTYL